MVVEDLCFWRENRWGLISNLVQANLMIYTISLSSGHDFSKFELRFRKLFFCLIIQQAAPVINSSPLPAENFC